MTGSVCQGLITVNFTANDRDGLSASGAVLSYTYYRVNGKKRTLTVRPYTADQDTKGTWSFYFQIPVTSDWGSNGSMTAFMKTTDKYGGTGTVPVGYAFQQGC
jgi:hypothetical protein